MENLQVIDALVREPCPHFRHHNPGVDGEELYGLYARLRDHPVAWSDECGGYWILSRFEDVRAALKDWETYSSAAGCFLPDVGWRSLGLESDPPEHGVYRRLFLPLAGRSAVQAAESELRSLTARIVNRFAAKGGGDAVKEISEILPVEAIGLMAGLTTAATERLRELTIELMSGMSTASNPMGPLLELLLAEIQSARQRNAGDFLSQLVNVEVFGRPIAEDEIANVLVSVVTAGHETTMNASANLMLELAQDRALQASLRDAPERIADVVEESLRHRAPVHLFFRTLTRDVTLHGVTMRKGDKVAAIYASANRDPERFHAPEKFDPRREDISHVSFGWGIHRCVGAPLSLAELRLLTRELLSHGEFVLDGEPGPALLEGGHHMGFKSLPIRFTTNRRDPVGP